MLNILIRNGQVVDGSGAPRYRADVAIEGDHIVEIGGLEGAQAEAVVDAAGCVVTPGFVDMHSHTDLTLPLIPTAESLVHQGITTAVVGQCGMSPAPLFAESRQQVVAAMEDEDTPLPWDRWSSFGSYLDYLGRMGTSINIVPLVGQGMVRAGVMGFAADPANGEQIARMQAEVRQAMDEGAIGVSTGLIYPPGSYASSEELIALTRPVGQQGGFYFSHIRGEGATLLTAVAEAIRIGRETGAAVEIAHFKASGPANWHLSARALELIERARLEGLDVSADLYPYVASSTGLKSVLPQWTEEGGNEATLGRLADSETRRRMVEDMQTGAYAAGRDWSTVLISGSPRNRAYEGRTVAELAADAGKTAHGWIFDALRETGLQLQMISFGMSEENRQAELRYPPMMIGTDGMALAAEGPLARGKPHPRSFGTFPRVLGYYVRQQEVISLEEAIQKMTGLPARKLRWTNRGLVKEGYRADLVVLNPETIADRATFENPHQYPAGIQAVIVNGAIVVRGGVHSGARPGEVLGR
jgi:N-acyl-D-amino-acid deacylase